jgi:hypothetical protein
MCPLRFGIATRSAQECRKAETNAVVVLHYVDAGEYLGKEDELIWGELGNIRGLSAVFVD